MTAIVLEDRVRIPHIADRVAFLRWAKSDKFPQHGWFSWLDGDLWVDHSMERFLHNQLKGIFAIVLGGMVLAGRLGRYLHDRMMLVCPDVNLATEPDGMFVSRRSLERQRVLLRKGGDSLEVEGVPDMALEVVSKTSVHKDTEILRKLYERAGIREYWLVDTSHETMDFSILRLTSKGYRVVRKHNGWIKSVVFGKSFKLVQSTDANGCPEFNLLTK